MLKKTISIILALAMILSMGIVSSYAANDERSLDMEEAVAVQLKSLNLFKGVSETNFDLGRAPSRIEALVIMLRLLGKESEILAGTYSHPFTDVPSWADKYVGYAYENGLTKGVSKTSFGTSNASASQFVTFVLRAMDYSDSNGDFTWDNPFSLATELGIIDDNIVIDDGFLRADCGSICYNALSAKLKDSEKTLADKLISDGVFTKAAYEKVKSDVEQYASIAVPKLAVSYLKSEGDNVYYSVKTVNPNYKSVVSNTITVALGLTGNYDSSNSFTVAELKSGVTASWPKSVYDSYMAAGGTIFAAYAEGELDAFYPLPTLEATRLSGDENGQTYHLKIDSSYTCPYTNLIVVRFSTLDGLHTRPHGFTIEELRKGVDYSINDARYAGDALNTECHFAF